MQFLLVIIGITLIYIAPSLALVGTGWSMTNVPSAGLTDITFPLTLVVADHFAGYYLAQQFSFVGLPDVGYTGLQPRPDSNGNAVMHAVFSSFIAGTTTSDSNCSNGADGGPGVSCAVEWNGVYGRTYNLEVKSAGNQLWVGTAVDSITGARVHIGSYTLPAGGGGIQSSEQGFVEWYPWNVVIPANHCALLPYQKTTFAAPTTTHEGSIGTQFPAYEYGDCVGKVAFKNTNVASGIDVECGFKGMTGTANCSPYDTSLGTYDGTSNYSPACAAITEACLELNSTNIWSTQACVAAATCQGTVGVIALNRCQNPNVPPASSIPNLSAAIYASIVGSCSPACPITQQNYIDFVYGAMSAAGVTTWPSSSNDVVTNWWKPILQWTLTGDTLPYTNFNDWLHWSNS